MVAQSLKTRVLAFICTLIFVISTHSNAVSQNVNDYWTEFRQQYPFHFQTLLISNPDGLGQRTLIIAEPPPGFRLPNAEQVLRGSFGDAYTGVKAKKHGIGFNGWVRDYVVTLSSPAGKTQAAIERQIKDGIAALSYSLYGTTYKAHALQLPIKQSQKVFEAPPNLSITPGELKSWLIDSNQTFVSVDNSQEVSLKTILTKDFTGTFLSKQPGLSLLVLNRSEDLSLHWSDLRKFSLDSDLILGALAEENDDTLVIVGRDRQTSLSAMPPLRAETILTLAAASNKELYQSFGGLNVLEGKISQEGRFKGKDWTPAFLSENLIDTELGSLLHMTDVLVKSWSEAGNIETVNFPYPKPPIFPFNSQPLTDRIGATKVSSDWQITYNWNTTGFGTVYDFGNYKVFAATKTGSLPVSYFSETLVKRDVTTEENLTKLADEAYDYFAQRRNVHLTQVAQYTALYQIFRAFQVNNVSWRNLVNQPGIDHISDELRSQAIEALQRIETGKVKIRGWENAAPEELRRLRELYGADSLEALAAYLADPQHFYRSNDYFRFYKLTDYFEGFEDRYRYLIKRTIDRDKVFRRIVRASEYEPASNIKTPTVVVSKWRDSLVGGHNLDSRVTKIVVDPSQPKGNVRIITLSNRTKELHVHPNDAVNNPSLARIYLRNFAGQPQFNIPPTSTTPPRSINKALEVKSGEPQGLPPPSKMPEIAKNVSFQPQPIPLTTNDLNQMKALAKEQDLDLNIKQLSDGSVIYHGHPPGFRYLQSTAALVEFVNSEGSMWNKKSGRVNLQNFSEGNAKGLLQSLQVKQPAGGGGVPPSWPPSGQSLVSDPEGRRWNFSFIPQADGKIEVIQVSRKQEGDSRPFFARRLRDKPDWSKARITEVVERGRTKQGQFQTDYQIILPVSQKSPIDLLIQAFSKKRLTQEDINVGQTAIQQALNTSSSTNATFEQGIVNLKQDIKKYLQPQPDNDIDLQFYYRQGTDDLIIIHRRDAQNDVL